MRDALHTMDYHDIIYYIEDISRREAQSARDSENLAMLVDRDDFGLNFEYTGAVTDPEDPEVVAERAKFKRAGIKPPPYPLLRPVAQRDKEVTASMLEQLKVEAAKYSVPEEAEKKPQGLSDLIRLMSS